MGKKLYKGNEAIAEAAILAGCRYFFGYPITPQNQIPEYMSKRLPEVGGAFVQAESEVSAINMVYGAAATGARVMTSSSSPGISLKQEGISYLCGSCLPCVVVNIMRGGPGLGGIQPGQSDYFQATRGGGHGDYRTPVLAPASVDEAIVLTQEAFDIAEQYRTPVMILGDGMLGQMMEPVSMEPIEKRPTADKTWAATGWNGEGRKRAIINSLFIDPQELEDHNAVLQKVYADIERNEVKYDTFEMDDAELVVVAYGTLARIAKKAVMLAREKGVKVGLFRPVTLWPFPSAALKALAAEPRVKAFLDIELSAGQMVEDVKLSTESMKPVFFHGRTGGMVPTVDDLLQQIIMHGEGK